MNEQQARKALEENLLIDFFLTVGLSKDLVVEIIQKFEKDFESDFTSQEGFEWMLDMLERSPVIKNMTRETLLTIYPDCNKCSDNDPRFNYLDEHKINELPRRAFPLGYTSSIKFQKEPPSNELLPMMYHVGDEKTFTLYMIFYESLGDQFYKAYKLYEKAQEEMDENEYESFGGFD